jgi:drug/metabolite transporter (DMT)-like permease
MIGVAGGLAAAVFWGASGIAATKSARILGTFHALAWIWLVGLAAAIPAAALSGLPELDGDGLMWSGFSCLGTVMSVFCMYSAYRRGPVVLAAPVSGLQGAFAALIAVAAGEQLGAITSIGLVAVTIGMYLAMRIEGGETASAGRPTLTLLWAAGAAATAGFALYATGQAVDSVDAPWLILFVRIAGVATFTLPLALAGRMSRPGPGTGPVVATGLLEIAAFTSYVYASASSGVAVPAVLASQYAAVTAVLAVILFRERLKMRQTVGVMTILVGVALVTTGNP